MKTYYFDKFKYPKGPKSPIIILAAITMGFYNQYKKNA